ncbi:MAG: DUF4136 domain-containing protein [Comamonadaceae bacterium]|nr:MAG: DUF4136 domain-containing protein [Comamonadaceae bacterium]
MIPKNINFPQVVKMLAAAFLGLALAGCASVRLVDNDVTTFSSWPAVPPGPNTPFRFERLPSQQADPGQAELEALARTALSKVGLVDSPVTARYSVQVNVTTEVVERFVEDPFYPYGRPSWAFGGPFGYGFPMTERVYKRNLTLLVRDLASNQVTFESRAVHDGPWRDSYAIVPAMLEAAVQGFPQPPNGTRRVNVQIPR